MSEGDSYRLREGLLRILDRVSYFRNLFILRGILFLFLTDIAVILSTFLILNYLDFSPLLIKNTILGLLILSFVSIVGFLLFAFIYFSGKNIFRVVKPYDVFLYSHLLGGYELFHSNIREYSKEFFNVYITRVASEVYSFDIRSHLFRGKIRRWISGLVVINLAFILLSCFQYREFMKAYYGRSVKKVEPAGIIIDVGKVRKDFFFPSYSNLQSITRYDDRRVIEALKGTVVRITVENRIDAEKAYLIVGNVRQDMSRDGRTFKGELNVSENCQMRMDFFKRSIKYSSNDFRIKVIPDENPEIFLTGPEPLLRGSMDATADRKIQLSYSAVDDYGVKAIYIVVSFADGKEKSFKIRDVVPSLTETSGDYVWDYSELSRYIQGDLMFAIEAEDNDTVSGPKRNRTRFYKILLPKSSQSFIKEIGSLKAIRSGMLRLLSLDLTYSDLEHYVRERNEARISSEIFENMDRFLVERDKKEALYKELARMKAELGHFHNTITSVIKQYRRRNEGSPPSILKDLIEQETISLEKNILILQELIEDVVYNSLSRLSKEISGLRDELKSLVNKYEETKDEELRLRIIAVMSLLEERIKEYREMEGELAKTFSDVNINKKALDNLSQSAGDIARSLSKLKEKLSQDDLGAFKERLSELDRMVSDMEGGFSSMLSNLSTEKYKELMDSLKGIAADIEEIINEERKVSSELAGMEGDIRRRQYDAISKELNRRIEEIIALIENLKSDISKNAHIVKKNTRNMREYETLVESQSLLTEIESLLKARQIFDSLSVANQVVSKLEWIKSVSMYFSNSKEYQIVSEDFYTKGQRIRDKIKEIIDSTRASLSQEEKKRLSDLLKRQDGISKRTSDLLKNLQRLNSEFGSAFDKLTSSVMGAEGAMRQASVSMGNRNIPLARSNADESISRLDEAMKEISKMKSRRTRMLSSSEDGEGEGRRERIRTADVQLPKKEDFKPDEKMRDEIIRALKEEDIKGFEDSIKRYYEEILK